MEHSSSSTKHMSFLDRVQSWRMAGESQRRYLRRERISKDP